MIELNTIYNEDCRDTMRRIAESPYRTDVILTSPFYNTNKKAGSKGTLDSVTSKEGHYSHVRYDVHVDNMSDQEYEDFTINLFKDFDSILSENGVVLYNISYGSEGMDALVKLLGKVVNETPFSIVDTITWKKRSALPNNVSPNRLTRITEYVFVLCRSKEFKTFKSNKRVVSTRDNGQKMYENVFNFVEAKNNDGPCPLNKATYSSELCEKLLDIYSSEGDVVYDPFMGSGTTAVASKRLGRNFIGSEISEKQVRWAENRVNEIETN